MSCAPRSLHHCFSELTLMQPFGPVGDARYQRGLSRRFEGTGLGLAVSKGFVELHGGTLTIESDVGRGTRVTVVLPQQASRRAHPSPRVASA